MENSVFSSRYQAVIEAPIPHVRYLGLRLDEGQLMAVDFITESRSAFVEEQASRAVEALHGYLFHCRDPIALKFSPEGTPFQKRVWRTLRDIPFGQVRRYGDIAAELGTSARAVANACRANPLPLLVPCHRVVSVNGPGGYMGRTSGTPLAIKLWLLQHEGHV